MIANNELVTQFHQLSKPVTVDVKDEVNPCHVLCTLFNLSLEDIVLENHVVIVSLETLGDFSIVTEISHILVDNANEKNGKKLPYTLGNVIYMCSPQK